MDEDHIIHLTWEIECKLANTTPSKKKKEVKQAEKEKA